ncbi:MAG TPA: hypothetical protein VFA70_07915 [Dehalococcoidia bacterium]|nr:hypothetical protein [Dehalococcoidia bacterium]
MSAGPFFEDVREGDSLPPLERTPEMLNVVQWSGATWTFVPIFYDRDLAQAQGLPDTLVPGPMKLALFAVLLQRWAGAEAEVRALRATYRRPDVPRRPLRFLGTVTRTQRADGEGLVDVELWTEDARGERTVAGAATVRLPLRG